jgi:hypothetical protein
MTAIQRSPTAGLSVHVEVRIFDVLQDYLRRVGICLGLSFPGVPNRALQRFMRVATAASTDVRHPATITLVGGSSVDWAESHIRR